ncbi:MAG: hypothetical protein K0S30_485 [Clostridia bacterium]|jgi:flagellar biosynthesis/type III secretory pathway protein FliH|nr:hypothetical protein [Clostridia bacterium]
MRLLSSIIKGGRIREQKIINLSERFSAIDSQAERNDFLLNEGTALAPQQEAEDMFLQEEQTHRMYEEAETALREAKEKARQIVEEAMGKADVIKEAAQKEKMSLLNEAVDKQKGILEAAKREAEQIVQDAETEKKHIIGNTESELAQTLMTLLQYLIGEEVYHNIDWLLCIIRKMLSNDALKKEIKIFVSPAMYNKLTDENKEKLKHIKEGVTLQSLETMEDTACRVETEQGAIEYDVKEGLDKVLSDIDILKNLKQERL